MICVIATIQVAAGRRGELIDLFRPLMPKSSGQQGCIEYTAMIDTRSGLAAQDPIRDNTLVVVENGKASPR